MAKTTITFDGLSVEEARLFVLQNYNRGVRCPCCNTWVKVWRKPLVHTAVYELIQLYLKWRNNRSEMVHISEFSKQRSNFYTLQYWGLVQGSERIPGKRTAGMWRPTEKGLKFIHNEILIHSHVETRDNKIVRFSGELIGIRKALGKKFDYDELMQYDTYI